MRLTKVLMLIPPFGETGTPVTPLVFGAFLVVPIANDDDVFGESDNQTVVVN